MGLCTLHNCSVLNFLDYLKSYLSHTVDFLIHNVIWGPLYIYQKNEKSKIDLAFDYTCYHLDQVYSWFRQSQVQVSVCVCPVYIIHGAFNRFLKYLRRLTHFLPWEKIYAYYVFSYDNNLAKFNKRKLLQDVAWKYWSSQYLCGTF